MARKKRKAEKSPSSRPSGAEIQVSPGAIRLAAPALVALFSLFAWLGRGVHEDGFFYLRVVDVFLHSGDLAYNPGERYETNTDFLWTLLLIPGPAAGLDDILWMQIVGVATYALTLWGIFALARKLIPDAEAALAALVLLGTHYTFTHFAATGFGAVLQALAAVCALLGLWRFGENPNLRNGTVLGLALSFLALCRLDSAVLGAPVALAAMFFAWRAGRAALPGIALALGIPAVVSAALLAWKLHYYGDIFPAPYYAKAAPTSRWDMTAFFFLRGASYLELYWKTYFLWAAAAAAAFGAWRALGSPLPRKGRSGAALLWTAAGMCALWHAYMFRTGGGLYEFRFMVPQAPAMMLLMAGGLAGLARGWRWTAVAMMLGFSLLHSQAAPVEMRLGNEKLDSNVSGAGTLLSAGQLLFNTPLTLDGGLRAEIEYSPENGWQNTGLGFRRLFADLGKYPAEVYVAHAAGGLPAYIAPLRWNDMRGLADPRVGRADEKDLWHHKPSVGHSIVARPALLARLGVNLMWHSDFVYDEPPDFSRPMFSSPSGNPRESWAIAASSSFLNGGARFPPDSQLFAMPLPNGKYMLVLYFNRNETIDRVLDERGIERTDVF